MEVTGTLDSVEGKCLEEKAISVFTSVIIDVKSNDITACHKIGKGRDSSKKIVVRFTNRKFAKQTRYNRKKPEINR